MMAMFSKEMLYVLHFSCNEDQTLQESLIEIQLCQAELTTPHIFKYYFRIDRKGVIDMMTL